MEGHRGYAPHDAKGRRKGNNRNGYTSKKLKGNHGEIEIDTPRDRNASFEPQIIGKGQTRITGMDDQILSLFAKGMSTRDIVAAFQEMYGADVSAGLASTVANAILDCIVLKIRQDKRVINKAIYLILGVNLEGHKELLGLWTAETERAKLWLRYLQSLRIGV